MRVIILLFCVAYAASLENPTRLEGSSEDENPVDGIDQVLQHYHQIDYAPFVSVEKAKEDALNAITNSISNLIKADQHDEAKRLFEGLDKPEILREVVKAAYDADLMNTVKLIEFLRSLDDKTYQMRGFSALYDEMKKRRNMRNPVIIEVAYWMRHHVEDADVALETDEFVERFLYYDTEKYSIINEAMQILGEKLRSGNSDQVLMLSKTYPGAFTSIVPKLIEATYNGDVSNFNAIMGLVRTDDLPQMHKEKVLDALLTQMHKNNHLGTQKFETLKTMINSSNMSALKRRLGLISRDSA
ncbi:hypothetical protein ACKWTF_016699 [Chironomus riparius]